MKILFINGSPNSDGNTASLARQLIGSRPYDTIELGQTKVYDYGQDFEDDAFDDVLAKMKEADVIVIGSPVYWHNMSGMVRSLLDHFYGPVSEGELSGRRLFFIYQGAAPEDWMLRDGEYTMRRFAGMYGMTYEGMASTSQQAAALSKKL
jgi:multimeric flavodoxin WrbA